MNEFSYYQIKSSNKNSVVTDLAKTSMAVTDFFSPCWHKKGVGEVAGHVWTLELGTTCVLGGCDTAKRNFPSLSECR